MTFDLSIKTNTGILSPEDVAFFYYDVGMDHLQSWPKVYDWNQIVDKFKGTVEFIVCKPEEIPTKVPENTIYFATSSERETDDGITSAAFFRHLRNAFSHYRICRLNDVFYLSDSNEKACTMNGQIEVKLLKKICFEFFNVREQIMEELHPYPPTI